MVCYFQNQGTQCDSLVLHFQFEKLALNEILERSMLNMFSEIYLDLNPFVHLYKPLEQFFSREKEAKAYAIQRRIIVLFSPCPLMRNSCQFIIYTSDPYVEITESFSNEFTVEDIFKLVAQSVPKALVRRNLPRGASKCARASGS